MKVEFLTNKASSFRSKMLEETREVCSGELIESRRDKITQGCSRNASWGELKGNYKVWGGGGLALKNMMR